MRTQGEPVKALASWKKADPVRFYYLSTLLLTDQFPSGFALAVCRGRGNVNFIREYFQKGLLAPQSRILLVSWRISFHNPDPVRMPLGQGERGLRVFSW